MGILVILYFSRLIKIFFSYIRIIFKLLAQFWPSLRSHIWWDDALVRIPGCQTRVSPVRIRLPRKSWEPPFLSGASISPMGPFLPSGDAMVYIPGSYPGFAGSNPALAIPLPGGFSCDCGSPQTREGCFRMHQTGHICQVCMKRAYLPCRMETFPAAYNTPKHRKEELAH